MVLRSGFTFFPHLYVPLPPAGQDSKGVCTSPGDKKSLYSAPPLPLPTQVLVVGSWAGLLASPCQCHWLISNSMLDTGTRASYASFHVNFITIPRKILAFEYTLIITSISILQKKKVRGNFLKEIWLLSSKASPRKWDSTSSKKEACILTSFLVLGPLLLWGVS